jgi:hypothetical protein
MYLDYSVSYLPGRSPGQGSTSTPIRSCINFLAGSDTETNRADLLSAFDDSCSHNASACLTCRAAAQLRRERDTQW